ncbi:DUF2586 domain-containing protein [Maridesulfovibrio sp.]|uniref:DUF2586 domain-containing protein n=1 Tax=Maridesulfovibrio sp. TaxID=2795000 RepID=UPI002AA94FBF|nr:DUF2586 domain-containing protein [Maridesulfovibrio sp.]
MPNNDVIEYLTDGTSGLVPGDVSGMALVAGVCSLGEVGKVYYLGKRVNLAEKLGSGPLVDRLHDIFTNCGQDASILAVPVAGSPAGYIGTLKHVGTGPDASTSGLAMGNAEVVLKVTEAGAPGVGKIAVSVDGGKLFGDAAVLADSRQVSIDGLGVTVVLDEGDLVKDDTYSCVVRAAIGPVSQIGPGPSVTAAGNVTRAAQIVLQIVKSGIRNEGQYCLSTDGGDNFGPYRTIPIDGYISAEDTGVTITCPADSYQVGTEYSVNLLAPVPSIASVLNTLRQPLELVDPEFVYVCGASDSVDWVALGALTDSLWNDHRPTFSICETRLPHDGEDFDDWVNSLKADRAGVAHRFVSVCAAFGEITNRTGKSELRNAGGLLVGRILEVPVQRDIGRVMDQGISGLKLLDSYGDGIQRALETAGFITAVRYSGLNSAYWGDARTLAEDTSDYRFLEVLRVVFKGVRLLRIQALKSLKSEAGDPTQGADAAGLATLRTNLENALDTMVNAKPKELAAYDISIPDGQDIANNGVAVEAEFIGIPIIKKIKIFANYVYAGSRFDPRLSSKAA